MNFLTLIGSVARQLRLVRPALLAPTSLRDRALKASALGLVELGITQTLRLISNLITSRALAPEAFGALAMVSTLMTAMTLFTDIGVQQSIIRSTRGSETHFLRAAWTIQLLRSIGIASLIVISGVLLWTIAPSIAAKGTVYADPDLPFLIIVSSLAMVFQGVSSTNQWLASRNMQYAQTTIIAVVSQAVSLLSTIAILHFSHSVWALIGSLLVGAASSALLSHVALKGPRMKLVWDKDIAEELWRFGRWIIGSSTFTFFAAFADRMILGAVLNSESFGLYIVALTWVAMARTIVQKMIGQVGFPILSEVNRERPGQLDSVFKRYSLIVDWVCALAFVGTAVIFPTIILAIYPDRYGQAAQYIPILASVILADRFSATSNIILAIGDSKTLMLYQAVQAIMSFIFIPISNVMFGITGAIGSFTVVQVLSSIVLIRKKRLALKTGAIQDILYGTGILVITIITGILFHIK